MYTRKHFPLKDVALWSYRDLFWFFLIAIIPVSLYVFADLKFLRLPWLPIAVLGTALAFILGFRNNASYDRLWEARKIWGGIVNSSRSWGIMVRDFISNQYAKNGEMSEAELKAVRKKIIDRHIAWMAAHRYGLRTPKPWENAMNNKRSEKFDARLSIKEREIPLEEELAKYLDEEELAHVLSKTNKATALIALQSKHIKELQEQGYIWQFSHLEMENMLVEFYTLQGKNERIKNFPYPRQFATLNVYFIWTFIILLPFGVMGAFEEMSELLQGYVADAGQPANSISAIVSRHFIWLTIPFCMIISWFFNGMDLVGSLTENPFGNTPNDIPITSMSRGIEIDMLEMIDADDIPDPIAAQHHFAM